MCSMRVVELPLDQLWAVWEAHRLQNGVPSPFQTPQFASCWLANLGTPTSARPLGVYSNEHLLAVFPLMESRSGHHTTLSLMGDVDTADYLDCIVDGEPEAVWLATILYLADRYPQGFTLQCQGVPENSPTLAISEGVANRLGLSFHARPIDVAPVLNLPSDWSEYLSMLGKHDRHELRRKLRRAEANGKLDLHIDHSGHPEALDTFIRLMKLSSPQKQAYMTPERERYFRCFARAMADISTLRLYSLTFNGLVAASIFCIEMNDTLYLYNSGYDPAWSHLSLGFILVALSIKDAIGRGVRRYDFLRGDERYKYDLGGRDGQITEVSITATDTNCRWLKERARYSLC